MLMRVFGFTPKSLTLKTTGSKFDPKRVIFDPAFQVNYAPTKKGLNMTPWGKSKI